MVDNELWAGNTAYLACTTEPESIVRMSFDGQGTAAAAGTVTAGLVGADRAMLWDPTTRSFYVTQCSAASSPCGTFYIQLRMMRVCHLSEVALAMPDLRIR